MKSQLLLQRRWSLPQNMRLHHRDSDIAVALLLSEYTSQSQPLVSRPKGGATNVPDVINVTGHAPVLIDTMLPLVA